MTGEYNKNPEARIQKKIEEWLNSKIFLASGSNYRIDRLKEAGFKNVEPIRVPDEVEYKRLAELLHEKEEGFADFPEEIALAKLGYVLTNHEVPEDAGVFAFDTMAMYFNVDNSDPSDPKPIARPLIKPQDLESAREQIKLTFSSVIDGYKIARKLTEEGKSVGMKVDNEFIAQFIRANTGYAVRLPNEKKIRTKSSSANLAPEGLYEIARSESNNTIESLIEQILAVMKAKGINLLNISGGVDYGDPSVVDILKIKEISSAQLGDLNQSHYLGLSSATLKTYLKEWASEF